MASNLVQNRCIYERSIVGEGGSQNVEMTPEMVALIQQLSQQMQSQNQVELEQARTIESKRTSRDEDSVKTTTRLFHSGNSA